MIDIEEFLEEQTENRKAILFFLHEFISTYPNVVAKIRYKVPFYYQRSWICYLNPIKKDGIELAFLRGNEMSNAQGILNSKGRKQVSGVEIFDVKDIDEEVLNEILQEAFILDETIPYASKRKSSKK